MSGSDDRLYQLLPAVYRQRDAGQGFPLQALLRVIAEQVGVVEDDIAGLYENWFIETCDDWVVPYIADLIGYRPVHEAGEPGSIRTAEERRRNRILVPRREVANTLRNRRRKGTLALLALLAQDVAGWPARAVELYRLLSFTQHLDHRRRRRGRTIDLRRGEALDRLDGPFDELAHNADLRHVASLRHPVRPSLPGVALYVWRLRSYSVTRTRAHRVEEVGPHDFTFSVLGNDTPLYVRPRPHAQPPPTAGELDLPIPIRRRAFELHQDDYYGEGKSLRIWVGELAAPGSKKVVLQPLPRPGETIVAADLTGWQYQPRKGQVAVDPELGRIAFPPRHLPQYGVWVSYQYGGSADIGGGEYDRPLSQPAGATLYQVGEEKGQLPTIRAALARWSREAPRHAVIEIADSRLYVEPIEIALAEKQTLQLRAARRKRPAIRLLDSESLSEAFTVQGAPGSAFTLDGLLVAGQGLRIQGDLAAVTLRHSTLVPGWGLHDDCEPRRPAEPSLELVDLAGRVAVEHCILGAIQVVEDEVAAEPLPLSLSDSILDATSLEREALSAPGHPVAHVRLTVLRSTVFGRVEAHALELGENSLFTGLLTVARRQVGCLCFSSIVTGSRTPRRFGCQPDLVVEATASIHDATAREAAIERERERVRPRFRSMRYGSPEYARLAAGCAAEIRRGADDESEMGVYHDLFEPQRTANLTARLDEHTPAGADAGLVFAD
jgi:hypothetical protein